LTAITEVAAAVIERPDGSFLLARRPEGKPYPGYWEFPGGKIEPGEDPRRALERELAEELDMRITRATPWITRVYAYTHATVRLHFFRVTQWSGEPRPLEGQALSWQRVEAPDVSPMLPANAPVLSALQLPSVMLVTDAQALGIEAWVSKFAGRAFEEQVLVQVREKGAERLRVQHLLQRCLARANPRGSRVVVNSDCGSFPQSDGVHLTSKALMSARERPAARLVGASAHDESELAQAARLGLDYAVVGPVNATASHAGAVPLGWTRFAQLIRHQPMPVYAIGGLTRADLTRARDCGAHGVALRSAAFN
jgi:8-oxo-dGTP diphosphatase